MGIAPKAKILPVRTGASLLSDGQTDANGIAWATGHGAKVICMAFAGADDNAAERRAIEQAQAADIVLVAGVGNRPESTAVGYPAAYTGVIAAAGVDRQGNHADVSVTGAQVALAAPGVDIVSSNPGGKYGKGVGTSAATAIIAGVAALVRAKYPELSAAEVVHRLTATATDKGPPGRDDEYGYGIVNPVAALTADVPALTPSAIPATGVPDTSPPTARAQPDSGTSRTPVVLIGVGLLILAAAAVVLVIRLRA
jgi:hypothetical protein